MRVLISFSDRTAMDVVALALEGYHHAAVHMAESVESLVQTLGELDPTESKDDAPGIDLIFCEHPSRSTIASMMLKQRKLSIPMVLFEGGKGEKTPPPQGVKVLGQVSWSTWAKSLDDLVAKAKFNHDEKDVVELPDTEFIQIRTRLLIDANPLPAEVYIRLSESKYLRIFNAGDHFDQDDYERYALKKGVGFFHLNRNALGQFVSQLAQSIQNRISEGMTESDATHFSEEIHQTTQMLLKQGSVPPEVGDLIKTNLSLTLQAIGNKPRLRDVLDRVLKDASGYLAGHSVALCQVTCTIASLMEWGSKPTFSKLNFAAFLHDCALSEDDQATIATRAQVEQLRAEEGDAAADAILMHGAKAAEMSRTFNEVPPDVDQIILQHHERPDGSGFPRGLPHTQISPMAALFIIAEDLVDTMYKLGPNFSYPDFVAARQELYNLGHFKKILRAIAVL